MSFIIGPPKLLCRFPLRIPAVLTISSLFFIPSFVDVNVASHVAAYFMPDWQQLQSIGLLKEGEAEEEGTF